MLLRRTMSHDSWTSYEQQNVIYKENSGKHSPNIKEPCTMIPSSKHLFIITLFLSNAFMCPLMSLEIGRPIN